MEKYCYYCMSKKQTEGICEICGHQNEPDLCVHHLPVGTVLMNRYVIGRVLGEGGFGITYISRDIHLDMVVAIKEYYPNGTVNRINSAGNNLTVTGKNKEEFFENGKKKFIQEARILAKFSGNKSIVDVRDFFECNNTAYIVMEYIQGMTLSIYIKNNGIFEATDLIQRMLPIFEALKLIHKKGLIHRDISPDNIMILQDGSLKLMDLGAVHKVNFDDKNSLSLILKYGYSPEEQYRSKGEQGPWTDIYAVCATIYKCITGITPDESTERVYADELQPPSRCGVDIPLRYEQALMKGLAVYQKDRYQSVDELIEAFSVKEGSDISVISINDLSDESGSDDKTEYYEEPEESYNKCENHSDDDTSDTADTQDNSKENDDRSEKKKKLKKLLKRVVLISVPAVLVIAGLIVALLIVPTNKKTDPPEATEKETGSRQTEASTTKSIVTTAAQETTGAEETTVPPKPQNPIVAKLSETAKLRKQLETTLSAGINHIAAIQPDGTTMAKGSNSYSECNISGWSDIMAISAGEFFTLGLKSDGTVVAQGYPYDSRVNVGDWTDIIAISAGASHAIALKSDGTVVATGYNACGQCTVGGWRDIVAISADCNQSIGLKSDGTVVAAGENGSGQCTVSGWKDIVAISAGWWHTVALKSDGTVVAMGTNDRLQCQVNDWKDIVAVSAGGEHTVGLKSDGTVIATGKNDHGQCNVGEWKDIVAVSARIDYTVGLKSDGTVVFTGDNDDGALELQGWKDIKLPDYLFNDSAIN